MNFKILERTRLKANFVYKPSIACISVFFAGAIVIAMVAFPILAHYDVSFALVTGDN
jgi:hypothetical protein